MSYRDRIHIFTIGFIYDTFQWNRIEEISFNAV